MRRLAILALGLCIAAFPPAAQSSDSTWQAGTARAVITPDEPLWMAGYGGRTQPAEGKLHDLWIRVLALEAADGRRAIVLSSDLLGFPQSVYQHTLKSLKDKFALDAADVMLCSSHTHCGPVLARALSDIYPLDGRQVRMIGDYTATLERKIVHAVGDAIGNLKPATLSTGQGTADFAVNRRNNREPDVPELRANNALNGPVDHAVPVLAVRAPDGTLRAVVFGYACHNTTLSFQQWCGDYAGFAQDALEQQYPGAVAMFHMGCGADQNPLPRRTVELCQSYAKKLATAVDAVLASDMTDLRPAIHTAHDFVTLDLAAAPTREELQDLIANHQDYRARWAARLLEQLEAGDPFTRNYAYPVQVWRLGGEQLWIALGGEVVVDYAVRFKGRYGADAWVTGYANDVMAYIPSRRVLQEGGYEGATSMMVYGLPAHRWADDVEERIAATVDRLARRTRPADDSTED